jgi:heterodisulfide reductase subunit B
LNLFKKKSKDVTATECKICHMKFSDPERTMRHMVKAHTKPTKNNKQIGSAKYR